MPAGWSDGTSTTFASSCADESSASASPRESPTTFGTSTRPLPFETLIVTVSPSLACAPADGSCETTVPGSRSAKTSSVSTSNPASTRRSRASASPSPTAFGTGVVSGPPETSIVTVEPSSTSVPAVGLCRKTVPSGASFASVTMSESRPASSISSTAWSSVRPSTAGTVAWELSLKYQ